MLPSDHRLAERRAVAPNDLAGQKFIGVVDQAPVLRSVIEDYLRRSELNLNIGNRAEYLSMAMSLVASTRAVTLLPCFACSHLTWSVTSRPLVGEAPPIDLVLGYNKSNKSRLLQTFLTRIDEMVRLRPT